MVLETHGGIGKLWSVCYGAVAGGVVFESDPRRADLLAKQRPTWAVYEADCVSALAVGVGKHLAINLLDIDPYGEPWPAIDAFFKSERQRVARLMVVVNDGLRQKLRIGAWNVWSMQEVVGRRGNKFADVYLDVCRELLESKAAQAGYSMGRFHGYYCGHGQQMTHYIAELIRPRTDAPPPELAESSPPETVPTSRRSRPRGGAKSPSRSSKQRSA